MPYLNLDFNYLDHPKTKRLISRLGNTADVLPVRLWLYCAKIHPSDGYLKGYKKKEIESLIGWLGPENEAIDALIEFGFMEESKNGFKCVDWVQHQGHIISFSIRGKAANKIRWDRVRKGVQQGVQKRELRNPPTIPTIPTIPTNKEPQTPKGVDWHLWPLQEGSGRNGDKVTQYKDSASNGVVYEIPGKDPYLALTAIQRVICAYKNFIGVEPWDRDWDKAEFTRCSKPAKKILDDFNGDLQTAIRCVKECRDWFENENLSWRLESVAKNTMNWKFGKLKEKIDV